MVAPLNEEEEEVETHAGLEQYEAQINTLIRQYMNKNSSYSTLNNIFSILFHFCTIPISRDTNTEQRLMQQLVEPLKDLVLSTTAEFSCEKHALECHFKRLKLLCKLYFIGAGAPRFDTYLREKRNSEENATGNSFLRAADKKRIAGLFTPEYCATILCCCGRVEEWMVKHMVAALNDCWVVLTQSKKVAKQKTNYLLIHSGTPCAYSVYSCESAVLYFLKYLSATSDHPVSRAAINQNLPIIIPFLLHYIAKKPASKTDPESPSALASKLGQSLLQKGELLQIFAALTQIPSLESGEELFATSLELLEKVTETKVLEFNSSVVAICTNVSTNLLGGAKISPISRAKLLGTVEEVYGKIWLQLVPPKTPQENDTFLALYSGWKKILIQHYAQSPECAAQFQLTFNTLVTGLSESMPESEPGYAKLAARLIMTVIKEVLALPAQQPFIKSTVSQYLQELSGQIQQVPHDTPGERIDLMFIVALNTAIALAPYHSDEIGKAFAAVLDLFDNAQVS